MLTVLDLSSNCIDGEGAKLLADILGNNKVNSLFAISKDLHFVYYSL